jgi:hypothetical protein
MDAEDRDLFAAALRRMTETTTGDALDSALSDIGWVDALADDAQTAVSTLFELQGDCDVTSTALDTVVATAIGLTAGRLVLPALGGHAAPGSVVRDRVLVRGLCRGAARDHLQVIAATPDGHVAMTVARENLRLRAVEGMDPALQLVEVDADIALANTQAVDWTAGVAAAQQALAHELVGTARAMLRLARAHALERVQFGRPIASFQAIRHRLAEALVAVEAAQAAADATWTSSAPPVAHTRPEDSDVASTNALLAKAVAGRSARIVARHAQQVLAGMGFTTEHPLHRHVRRALVLDGMFGSTRALTHEVGAEALRSGRLPRPVPL